MQMSYKKVPIYGTDYVKSNNNENKDKEKADHKSISNSVRRR